MTSGNRFSVEGLEPRRLLSQTFANGNDNDIVRDTAGTEHLAYRNVTPTPPNGMPVNDTLWYVARPAGGAWSAPTAIDLGVGPDGTRGTLDDVDVGEFVSINVDANNRPGVAYYDATNGDLKYAKYDGTAWNVLTADTHGVTGLYPSLVFNASSRPHIAYYKSRSGTTPVGDLRVSVLEPSGWVPTIVDETGDVGRYPSIAIQGSSGRWGIAYQDTSNEQFKYARQTSALPAKTVVDNAVVVAGGFTSLAFDPDDNLPTFTYYGAEFSELKFARATDVNGGGWTRSVIAGLQGNSGKYNNLWYRADGGQSKARVTYYNQSERSIYLLDETGTLGSFGAPTLVLAGGGLEHEAVPKSAVDFTYTWVEYHADDTTTLYVNDTETGKNWTEATSSDVGLRTFHAATVFTDPADSKSRMWVLGGIAPYFSGTQHLADVRKSETGVTWETVTTAAAFGGRAEFAALAHGGHLWAIGGSNGSNGALATDTVYKSADGQTWANSQADLPPVRRHAAVVFPDPANSNTNTMWVIGGIVGKTTAGVAILSDDIYKSVDGATWTKVNDSTAFGARFGASVVHRGNKLYLIGGMSVDVAGVQSYRDDVWTSANGVTWTRIADDGDDLALPDYNGPSFNHAPAMNYDNRLWLVVANQPWYSFDGARWTQAGRVSSVTRDGHAATVFGNKMWVLGGTRFNPNGYLGDAYWSA